MPPSQLKQLKASLKEHGVLGPQKSKKEKKRNASGGADAQKRLARHEALQGIRDRFNPFEVKAPARKVKFDVTSNRNLNGPTKGVQGRPGVTKSLGEQKRRETLLTELHRKNKVGGLTDRRFGEDDPNLTPEQRAAERYARETEKRLKRSSMFNLEEDDEEDEIELTHGGRSLAFGDDIQQDDFEETDLLEDDERSDENGDGPRKRRRLSELDGEVDEDGEEDGADVPDRPKSKKEVMEEVIAKSKLHRYERQKTKEDDDLLREELNKGLPEFFDLLRNYNKAPEPRSTTTGSSTTGMNPDRAAMLMGKDRKTADDEYNERVRQMAMDARSKPSERTKTEEEQIEEEAARLRELESQRLKRMQGEDDEDEEAKDGIDNPDNDIIDDAEAFGLNQPAEPDTDRPELDVEDEDEFEIDDDLVASDPDADISLSEEDESDSENEMLGEDDDEFIDGLTLPDQTSARPTTQDAPLNPNLAYTYPCPSSHEEFLKITKDVDINDLPTIVQRIRALYHPKLNAANKGKLEIFSKILVDHVAFLARQETRPPSAVLEALLRHIHSLAKTFPLPIGLAFREHLLSMSEERPLSLDAADLVLLTGVLHIFPTSDHFHSVVTPSLLTMARYLAQSPITSLSDLSKGLYCCTLSLDYQKLSKRYIPEVMLYLLNTLLILASTESKELSNIIAFRAPSVSLRIQKVTKSESTPLKFSDMFNATTSNEELKAQLIFTCVSVLETAANLWSSASAFPEIITPACSILSHLLSKPCTKLLSPSQTKHIQSTFSTLQGLLSTSLKTRQPLLLHNHRPLAIKLAIPKFEEGFNPDRHYDPDRERAEISKLKAEHKRERKGAMRELRKDSNFVAREALKDKKERDAAYEKKYRRLVAEIQGEEGRESKEYDKERRKRKGNW